MRAQFLLNLQHFQENCGCFIICAFLEFWWHLKLQKMLTLNAKLLSLLDCYVRAKLESLKLRKKGKNPTGLSATLFKNSNEVTCLILV
jgi:hypothetical protein